jgi:surfeit locus 1 family protein
VSTPRLRFEPRPFVTIAAAAFIALTVGLGRWQAHRAQEKEARQALYEARMSEPPVQLTGAVRSPEPILFRRVRARGRWIPGRQVYVDNRVHEGKAGFEVITPLRIEPGEAVVLVDRGWVARTAAYPDAPPVAVPEGAAETTGLATVPNMRFIELSSQAISGSVFQNLTIDRFRAWSGLAVLPIVILDDHPGPGLAAVSERPDAGVAMHRQYEFTWFLLAATALALWIALNLRRAR